MTNSFWAGGAGDYADSINKHYKPLLQDLRDRRDAADDTERAEIDSEIERLETEYNSKLNSIDDSLF